MQLNCEQEMYTVHDHVWKRAGIKPYGGCLCIGCIEKRIGRPLMADDFPDHLLNEIPGTERLLERRGHFLDVIGDFPEEILAA